MKKIFSFLFTSLFCFCIGNAQQLTKNHTVKKGETVYELSKLYNVSIQDIIKLNPKSERVIYVGDVLTIPSESNNSNENDTSINNSTYFVKRGDTKYGLSKKFGISISELESKNPHIKKGLQAGHLLSLKSTIENPTPKVSDQNISYKSHSVLRGETLYGLSRKYQVSVQEIKSANPQLGILKYDTTILIPYMSDIVEASDKIEVTEDIVVNQETSTEETVIEKPSVALNEEANNIIIEEQAKEPEEITETVVEPIYEDYIIQPKETLYSLSRKANMSVAEFTKLNPQLEKSVQKGAVIKMPKPISNNGIEMVDKIEIPDVSNNEFTNLQLSVNKNDNQNLLLVMPFTKEEYTELEGASKGFNNITDANLKRDLEFYRGTLLAIDSIEKLDLTIKSDIIKIDTNASISESNINSKNKLSKDYNAIIAPSYGNNIDWVSSLAYDKNIPVITAFNASSNKNLTNIVEAAPTIAYQKLKMLDYLKNKKGNIIVVSDYEREDSRNFIATNALQASFINTKKNGNFSSRDLSSLLDDTKTNFVIIDSERNGVFLNTTNVLLKELSNYKIQLAVLESSLIPNEENISSKRFKILKMLYPVVDCVLNKNNFKQFSEQFKSKYGEEPSLNVLYGFDITFDTLLRLSQSNEYTQDLSQIKTAYLCLKFDFQKEENGRHINNTVLISEFEGDTNLSNSN